MSTLEFRPIKIQEHPELLLQFQADAYRISFADENKFTQRFGPGGLGYLQWLKEQQKQDDRSVMHLWQNEQIVGQVELGRDKGSSALGFIYFFYLVPSARNQGLGKRMEKYAVEYFRSLGIVKMRLHVTSLNELALKFYANLGWKRIADPESSAKVICLEKLIF